MQFGHDIRPGCRFPSQRPEVAPLPPSIAAVLLKDTMFSPKLAAQFQARSQAMTDTLGNLYVIAFMEIPALLQTFTY